MSRDDFRAWWAANPTAREDLCATMSGASAAIVQQLVAPFAAINIESLSVQLDVIEAQVAAYEKSPKPGQQAVADLLRDLPVSQVVLLLPELRTAQKKRGAKPDPYLADVLAKAFLSLRERGYPDPSLRAISKETARLRQLDGKNAEPEHERRRLGRQRKSGATQLI